jgi:dihydropteroate synthase
MPSYIFNGFETKIQYPAVMGILNLTPDSFSDGGKFIEPERAVEQAFKMHSEGAQIIDIGAESTRPGSEPVSEQEELIRILPVLEKLPKDQFLISLDTTKPNVAQAGLQAGVHVINDVSGGQTELFELAKKYHAGYVLMHCMGTPKNMQDSPQYNDLLSDIRSFFDQKKDQLAKLNLPRIWMDPGIGFGKTLEHNITIMKNLSFFHDQSWGLFLGSSRKSWIHHLCNAPETKNRLGGSIASAISALSHKVEIIRAHDVLETAQAIKVAKELALFE